MICLPGTMIRQRAVHKCTLVLVAAVVHAANKEAHLEVLCNLVHIEAFKTTEIKI